jgi:hypothetical protein
MSSQLNQATTSNLTDGTLVANGRKSGPIPMEVLLAAEARLRGSAGRSVGLGVSVSFLVLVATVVAAGVAAARFGASHEAAVQSAQQSVQDGEVKLARRVDQTKAYRKQLHELGHDLAEQRCTLAAGVERLRQSPAYEATAMGRTLRGRLPGRSEEECVAVTLMEAAFHQVQDPMANEQLSARLGKEFQATYHRPSPPFGWKTLDTTATPAGN